MRAGLACVPMLVCWSFGVVSSSPEVRSLAALDTLMAWGLELEGVQGAVVDGVAGCPCCSSPMSKTVIGMRGWWYLIMVMTGSTSCVDTSNAWGVCTYGS
eukprot:6482800-Amphidinium_carterae.2